MIKEVLLTTRRQSAVLIPPGPTAADTKQKLELAGQEHMNKMEEDLRKNAREAFIRNERF